MDSSMGSEKLDYITGKGAEYRPLTSLNPSGGRFDIALITLFFPFLNVFISDNAGFTKDQAAIRFTTSLLL